MCRRSAVIATSRGAAHSDTVPAGPPALAPMLATKASMPASISRCSRVRASATELGWSLAVSIMAGSPGRAAAPGRVLDPGAAASAWCRSDRLERGIHGDRGAGEESRDRAELGRVLDHLGEPCLV